LLPLLFVWVPMFVDWKTRVGKHQGEPTTGPRAPRS